MSQQIIASPCNSICTMNPQTGFCNGCMRTIEEIMQWGSANDSQKQVVLDSLDARWFEERKLGERELDVHSRYDPLHGTKRNA